MNILFISNLFPSSVEPARATYNLNLMKGLRQLGHELMVVAPVPWVPGFDGVVRGRKAPPRCEIIDDFAIEHPRYFYTPGFWIDKHHLFYRRAIGSTVTRLVREKKADVAILGFLYPDAVAAAPLCRDLKLPYIVRVNGSDFRVRIEQNKFSPLIREVLSTAPGVVCPGQALAEAVSSFVPGHPNVRGFNNGIDKEVFFPSLGNREKRILFVGNLVDIKGPDRALAAFVQLARNDSDTILEFVGDGPLRKCLFTEAAKAGVADRVIFHGRKSPVEVATLMRKASCLILSSRSEGMPNVVLEALACGTPVVATEVGEVPCLVKDDVSGFTVKNLEGARSEVTTELGVKLALALGKEWDHAEIAKTMAGFSWETAARVVVDCIGDV